MAKKASGVKKKATPKKSSRTKAKLGANDPKEAVKAPLTPEIIEPEVIDAETLLPVEDNHSNLPATVDEKGLAVADPVVRYLAEIRRYPLLTREEEYELAVRYREKGDREAAQKLVTSNLRFVVKIAAEYSKFGARMIDLIQEGNMGLMQAVREYNPYKGVRLITYAVWWIRGQIQDYLMRHYSMVRIGTTAKQRKLFYELQRQKDQLERMGFEAGIAQLSGRLGISNEDVKEMGERVLGRDVSLNAPTTLNEATTLIDLQVDASETLPDEQLGRAEELKLLKDKIEVIRPSLNERELYLLENRILADDPITLQEFGDKYGVTREAARQLEARLIEKIRKQMITE